ncbi:MAG TPA: YSC84-related protein [Burkholderiales bacterium]|nr:YSC84-related protein [Burkholderiales bacterium]
MRNEVTRQSTLSAIVALCLALQGCETAPLSQPEKLAQQDDVRYMANKTLEQFYAENSGTRDAVKFAAGYAVFSDTGFKFLIGGGANGKGIAINNSTKQATFMKMIELQPGLGFGVSKFRVLFVFQWPQAYDDFVTSGWEFGANAMAAAKTAPESGGAYAGAVSVSPGVFMYQLTEKGVIVGVSLTGAKFYKDSQLN